jgi:PAS domain S-box-containing protein
MIFAQQMTPDLLRAAVAQADDGIYVTDLSGQILFANEAIAHITGYSSDELTESTTRIFRSGLMPDSYYERLWETVLSGEVWRELITNRRADGTNYEAFQTIAPIKDSSGSVTMLIAVQRDLTSQPDIREELRRSQTDVERLLQEKETLLREVYHRAKNDLLLGASMLRLQAATDDGGDAKTRLEEAAARTDALSRAYQYFEEHSTSARVDVSELVAMLARDVCEARAPQSIDLNLNTTPVAISSRVAVSLAIILNELIVNSIKYALVPYRTLKLNITVSRDHDTLILGIEDNGPGIPEGVRTGEKSGFGMQVIRSIVAQRRGTLTFADLPGAKVAVSIPLT